MTKTEDDRIRRLYTMGYLPVLRSINSQTVGLICFDPLSTPGE